MKKFYKWEEEEFEYQVEAGLVALHEPLIPYEAIFGEKLKTHYLPNKVMATPQDHYLLRKAGIYFSPGDRVCPPDDSFWYDIDGFPPLATIGLDASFSDELASVTRGEWGGGYLEVIFARKIKKFPRGVVVVTPSKIVAKYRMVLFYPQLKGGVRAFSYYFGVAEDGKLYGDISDPIRAKVIIIYGSMVLNYFTDRLSLWNVDATDGEIKVTFGVYEEQIKSLL